MEPRWVAAWRWRWPVITASRSRAPEAGLSGDHPGRRAGRRGHAAPAAPHRRGEGAAACSSTASRWVPTRRRQLGLVDEVFDGDPARGRDRVCQAAGGCRQGPAPRTRPDRCTPLTEAEIAAFRAAGAQAAQGHDHSGAGHRSRARRVGAAVRRRAWRSRTRHQRRFAADAGIQGHAPPVLRRARAWPTCRASPRRQAARDRQRAASSAPAPWVAASPWPSPMPTSR